jgi:hypothetical protein
MLVLEIGGWFIFSCVLASFIEHQVPFGPTMLIEDICSNGDCESTETLTLRHRIRKEAAWCSSATWSPTSLFSGQRSRLTSVQLRALTLEPVNGSLKGTVLGRGSLAPTKNIEPQVLVIEESIHETVWAVARLGERGVGIRLPQEARVSLGDVAACPGKNGIQRISVRRLQVGLRSRVSRRSLRLRCPS